MRCVLAVSMLLPLSAQTVLVRSVRIFDGERVMPRASVLVQDGVIRAVGVNLRGPGDAEVINGEGKTLLPGLIDAHTHTATASELKQALAFGVTTELDMFSRPANIAALRRALDHSDRSSDMADVRFAGICATAPGGHGTEYNEPIPTLSKPEEAQSFVDARLAEGSDHLKVIYTVGYPGTPRPDPNNLSRETMTALIQAAHRRGRLAVVHVDAPDLAREAIEAGADVLAHIYLAPSADPMIAKLARQHKTAITPTLSVRSNTCGLNPGAALATDPLIAPYLTASSHQTLTRSRRPPTWLKCDGVKPAVADLHHAGISLLAGTDVANAGTAHGVSLHSEMALLVDAGLTPLEALKAATSAPADAFRLRDRGRVAEGKRADLLLVDGDPTTNIRATRNIIAVWKQGRRLDREVYRASVASLDAPVRLSGVKEGLVSNFDNGSIHTAFGSPWEPFDGVQLKPVTEGAQGSTGSVLMSGEVKPDRPAYIWPGIAFMPSGLRRVFVDLSSKSGLRFWAKGDGRAYRVVIVSAGPAGTSQPERVFKSGPEWQEYRFAFADFPDLDPQRIRSIILGASRDPGSFKIQLDEISFY